MITSSKSFFSIRTALVAALVLATLGPRAAQSQIAPGGPDLPNFRSSFGMVGLAPGQVIRLSAVNAEPPPDPDRTTIGQGSPPEPERVELFLFDGAGHEIGKREAILKGSESTHLSLSYDELVKGGIVGPDRSGRLNLWGAMSFHHIVGPDHPRKPFPPDPCIPTLEVLDEATRKVVLICPPGPPIRGIVGPDRQFFGLLGVTEGQTARINIVQEPPGPPTVPPPPTGIGVAPGTSVELPPGPPVYPVGTPVPFEVVFIDAAGTVLLREKGTIGLGRGFSLDLPAALLLANGQTRVRAVVQVFPLQLPPDPIYPPGPCRSTLEIFDSATGITSGELVPAVLR